MASPLAHALVGVGAWALAGRRAAGADWRPAAWAAFAAAAADLDFLPGLLVGDPSRYHHWATHSLAAALLFGLAAARLAGPALGPPGYRVIFLGLAYATHLGLDLATVDRTVPEGIPLLWPVSDATYQAPVTLFRDLHHGRSWAAFLNWHNAGAVLAELVLVGGPLGVLAAWRRARTGGPAGGIAAAR